MLLSSMIYKWDVYIGDYLKCDDQPKHLFFFCIKLKIQG